MDRVVIFDTTLRDGEQSPGATLNAGQKLEIARQLARLGVDIIEAGFPISSPDEFDAVRAIAEQVREPIICALARAKPDDVDAAWGAIKDARRPRIHVFMSTSDVHLQHQFRMTREQALDATRAMVARARGYCEDIEFSPMDASRTEPAYLYQVLRAAIEAGATTLNIPDTVGYATPEEYGAMIAGIIKNVPGADKTVLSVHCHDDLGLAVANSLVGIRNGARQVECTINGIGERAGNASLEEVVMALRTRADAYGVDTGVDTTQLYKTSRLVTARTGLLVQANKAIVGSNAFAHESGIHQDGVLKERSTYEIMDARSVGLADSNLVLGKHSGRHALKARLQDLGYELSNEDVSRIFLRFKDLADKKKQIEDADLLTLVMDMVQPAGERFKLKGMQVVSGEPGIPSAAVRIEDERGELHETSATGTGPVDAAYKAIDKVVGAKCTLLEYVVQAVTEGIDAIAEVTVRITGDPSGSESPRRTFAGHGSNVDVIVASARAYLNALNRMQQAPESARQATTAVPVGVAQP
ncbi:MAG TPA: 2-isopropylmalate synthase [Chloroflexota bacterium]|nr:2-isopropylmalate synthase [Chloroflexota bacterium]